VGTTTITASQAGNANYNAAADVTQTLTVNKANQSITFASTNSKTYGDADYAPGATSATSGTNAITYASSNAAVATIVAGQIHIVAPGTTTITASQAGNANYNAAADATQTLTVNPKSLTITGLTANSKYEDGNTNATLTGTAALSGVISGDDVSLTGTAVGTFASAAVGININVTVSNLSLTGTSASNYSLTTLILTADIIANSPTIFSSGTLSAVNTTYGSASPSPSSFSVSAQSLTDPVTITAPSGFEVSTNISSGYSSSINVGTSGTLASTTIYVRLTNATTVAASPYSGNIVLSSNGATSVNVATASSTVSQKNLTITGMTTANKVYDGTNSAIVTGGSLVGILGSDVVTLTQSGTFAQTSVGTNIVITSTSTIGGAASGNYTLTQPSLTLRDITTKPLSITTATIASKVYDGTTTSGTVTAGTLSGFIGSDTVVVASANGTYSDANVGTGKTATITYTLGNGTNGGLATNYSLANTSATGNITQATQTITFSSFTTPITASTTIVASSNFGGTITYSSSNTNVATINSSTGVVTIAGNGTTTITASNAGNSNYTAASTSQVLTVNSAVTSTLAAWEVTGLTGYGPSPFTATTISNNVTVGGLTKGNGIGSQGTAASNAWGGTDLDKTSSNDATSGDDFISFTINANIGYTVSFTQIPSYNIRRSSSGATTGLWQYSIDGSNFTNIGSAITWGGTTTSGGNSQSAISLSGITDLQNVPNSTTITFRLVLYGASNTTGTWYINNITGDDLAVTGTVNCTIPSQSSAISGTTTVCSGSAQTYSVTNVSGVGYNWSLPGGWSGSSTSNSISATVGSSGGNISVTPYNSATGCTNYAGTAQSISVTVNASPTAPAATITQPTCSVATGTITITSQSDVQYSINGTDYQVSNVFSGLSPNTYTIYVRSTLTGSCVASTGSQVVNAQPGAPGIPSAPTASAQSLCSGSSVSNLVATGTSIQWYDAASNGILLAGGTSLTAGTYYASQTVSGCESSTRTSVAVTINSTGTWIGGASGNWNVAGNWCGGVPNSSSTISIPTSTTVSIDASSNVLDITIGSGATLNFSGSHIITIAAGGSFMNNGTFVAGTGTVAYAGAGTLDGSASTFNNLTVSGPLTVNTSPTINGILTINNGGSIITNPITYGPSATLVYNQGGAVSSTNYEWPTVNLPTNVTIQNASNVTINESKNINGILTLTSGDLILGANILTLGASASISSASSSSHIDATSSGEVRKIYNGNGSFTFPVGDGTNYTPATLNFTAGSSITGATDDYVGVRLKTSKVTGMNNTNQHYINRAWFIEPGAGLSGYTYSVELSYCNADIIGTESLIRPVKRSFENSVYVWYYPGDVNFTDGIQLTGTTSEINTITKGLIWSGLTSFSEFGGVGQGGLLPVDLLFFNANAIENKVKLYWATSLEINNEKFEIERSADAVSFTKIATVSGGGNTTTLQNYTVYDEQPLSGWSYYRLKQIDFDQAFEYSNVASVYFEEGEFAIAVYPNPAQNSIMIQTFGDAKIYNAAIYNSFGQEIRKAESNINMSIEDLASGTYTIKVQTGLHIITKQFVKF
jgi:hypothetical protein